MTARLVGSIRNVRDARWRVRRTVSFEIVDGDRSAVWLTPGASRAYVADQLRGMRPAIASAAALFAIPPSAIAGAIAWEALENPRRRGRKAPGLGKVQARRCRLAANIGARRYGLCWRTSSGTLARDVEEAGYLPARTDAERREHLRSVEGAVMYIAAIMRCIADAAAEHGFVADGDPAVLATVYHGWTLERWRNHLAAKPAHADLRPGGAMGLWVSENIAWLETASYSRALEGWQS